MTRTKLAALDREDLAVISAHMQDAVIRVGDIRHFAATGKLVVLANRFAWETGEDKRRRCGLHFDRVLRVSARRIRRDRPDAVLALLAIVFEPGEHEPSGTVAFKFSGGGELRAEVECIEARLEDLEAEWRAVRQPSHALDDDGTRQD